MSVTHIAEWKAKSTVEVLRALLAKAERGKISGFVFACKEDNRHQGIGMTGDYRDDPLQVLAVNERIRHVVNEMIDARCHG
jgi:hypothetical protein